MKVMIVLFVVIFVAAASSVLSDINIVARTDLSKIKTVSKNNVYSEEVIFEDGKAIWQGCGDFYFAFYNGEALKLLADCDSTKVVLAPRRGEMTPSFGNLYIVLKNIFGDIGVKVYGLDVETFYVWPVEFSASGIGLKDEDGVVYYKGVAPFGDDAIQEIKLNGREITKDFFVSLENGNKKQ